MPLSEAEFLVLCEELRTNHPQRTRINNNLPPGYGRRLGEALRENNVVSDMTLDLRSFQVIGENGGTINDNIFMLLRFLRESVSLLKVNFCRGTMDATNPCLQAISLNKNLREFILDNDVEISSAVLAAWVGSTITLERLVLPMEVADEDEVATALGVNSSVSTLVVHTMSDSSTAEFLRHIGQRTTPTALAFLTLSRGVLNGNVVAALSWFASSSSIIIQKLSLGNITIEEGFLTFAESLSSRPCMIAEIDLHTCVVNEATASVILAGVTALQNSIDRDSILADLAAVANGTAPVAGLNRIFVLGHHRTERSAEVKFVTALVLLARHTLNSLSWLWNDESPIAMDDSLLWSTMDEQLVTNGTGTGSGVPFRRLRSVHLRTLQYVGNDAMFRCLPKLVSLSFFSVCNSRWYAYLLGRSNAICHGASAQRPLGPRFGKLATSNLLE